MRRGLVTMLALAGTAGAAWAGSSSTIVVGGSPAQRAAVREAVHALGGTIVERIVFAYSAAETQGMFTFYVRPDLYGCADDLPIQNEVAPDGAPPCPA